jgi:CubicO group peptidase (beta-lactamase class C family)
MSNRRRCTVLSVLLTLCLSGASLPAAGQRPTAAPPPADTAARLDAVVKAAYGPDQPGAAVLVVKDGRVIYRGARGLANLELGVPLQPDMVFRLGSITKQFTAAAIMLLVADGRLALDDPIEKHLPGYPTQGHTITIEHLLTHTSGIQSYTDMPGWMESKIRNDMTVQELIDGFKREPMQFAPGRQFRYNNSGYVLLGAIIEKVSGTTYEKFVTDRIFTPLGMTSTYYGSNEPLIAKRVDGYTRDGEVTKNARYLSMTQPYAAGSLVSSVDDLARWDAALTAGTLLTPSQLERMWRPYTPADGKPSRYGYGFGVSTMRGRPVVEHGGGIHGFSTYALRMPEDRVYVAVLCTSDSPKTEPGTVAKRLAAVAIGRPFPEPVAITLAPSVLEGYVGVYEFSGAVRRTITVEGAKIYSQRAGSQRLEVHARSETEFFFDGSLSEIRFERDAHGRATAMLLFADGADERERGARVADAPAGPSVARVDPAIYDGYVGHYELAPGFVLTVTREGDRLMTQATGQDTVEIFPSSETEYFLKVVDARITFVRGADGKATGLVLHQGGRDMPATRK